MKILVTGGAGFIGSHLAAALYADGHSVVAFDNLSTGRWENVVDGFVEGDVNSYKDLHYVMLNWKFDYVFHYAAVVGVKRTLENPLAVLKDIDGIKNVLDLCNATGVKRVFFASSSEVYGEPVEIPQHEETTPINSRLPYAVVKNMGEIMIKSYFKEYGLAYTIFRFFNTYGPRQSQDFVMSKFIQKALNNEDIPIYGEGFQKRTFCYIDDNVEAVLKCMNDGIFLNDTVNIGSDEEITILGLASLIIKITGSKSKIVYLPPLKEGDMTRRKPDVTKMNHLLQKPFISIEEGIKNIL